MSSQKGNSNRSRPQKHQNHTAFKNTLHDTSHRTKFINSIQVTDVCLRCKEIIEWKIKYKKYKPLSQPKKCVTCEQKTVKKAYHVMCVDCGRKLKKCTKCCQSKEVLDVTEEKNTFKMDKEMKLAVKLLSERKRRTFQRYFEKIEKDTTLSENELKEALTEKLENLNINNKDDDFDDCLSDSSGSDEIGRAHV